MKIERERIGQIGADDRGVRFVVLAPGSAKGTEVDDEPTYVVLLNDVEQYNAIFAAGHAMHVSYLKGDIEWERDAPQVKDGKQELVVRLDTPCRTSGLRPTVKTTLAQITNPLDGGYVAIVVDDDRSMRVVIHLGGDIRVERMR